MPVVQDRAHRGAPGRRGQRRAQRRGARRAGDAAVGGRRRRGRARRWSGCWRAERVRTSFHRDAALADHGQAARHRPAAAAAAHRFRDAAGARGAGGQARRLRVRCSPAADVVILSDYGKGGLAHIATMIERARAAGKPVLVDPKGDDFAKYRGATLLTPNRGEFRAGRRPLERRGRLRRRRRRRCARDSMLDALLVTRSEEGMTLFTRRRRAARSRRWRARCSTSPARATP